MRRSARLQKIEQDNGGRGSKARDSEQEKALDADVDVDADADADADAEEDIDEVCFGIFLLVQIACSMCHG